MQLYYHPFSSYCQKALIAFDEYGIPFEPRSVDGPDSPAMHAELGEAARKAGISRLYCAGPHARAAAEAFGSNAEGREDVTQLADTVQSAVRTGITVLVKGSRSMGMERVVQALAAPGAAPPA